MKFLIKGCANAWILTLIAALSAVIAPKTSFADLAITAAPTIAVPQSGSVTTGSFEIDLTATGGDVGDQISGDQFRITLPGQSYVTFTGGGRGTIDPYIFPGVSGAGVTISNNSANITDVPNSSTITLSSAAVGILTVDYSIAANTPVGTYALTINATDPNVYSTASYFLDQDANFIGPQLSNSPFSMANGTALIGAIVVNPAPEPSTWALFITFAMSLCGYLIWRRVYTGQSAMPTGSMSVITSLPLSG